MVKTQSTYKELIKQGLTKDEQEETITRERTKILQEFLKEAIKVYQKYNKGTLPDPIIVYRDGVGGPSFFEKALKLELEEIIPMLDTYEEGYKPKVLYVFVDKFISTRFAVHEGQGLVNPAPGTVVDTSLVEESLPNAYDFYLIPHKATIATALPVHYKVAYNTTGLDPEKVKTYTYQQCYGYFNFMGSIKVPHSVMYAHKLANYAHDLGCQPSDLLSRSLHYL